MRGAQSWDFASGLVKVYLYPDGQSSGNVFYTVATIRHFCALCGVAVVDDVAEADVLWVSLCDPSDLPVLRRARKIAESRPVVMGGFESYFGEPYLAWADYVVVGEGWEFISAWGRDPAAALGLPCVLSADADATPSYTLPFERCPVVRMPGGRKRGRYYSLATKGCKQRCAFCATSWAMPYQQSSHVRAVGQHIASLGGQVTFISNDDCGHLPGVRVPARSARVRDYLRAPAKFKAGMVHFGVEGWTADACRWLGKPLPDEALRELFYVTERERQRCELFFIADYPGWRQSDVAEWGERIIHASASRTPTVHVKVTYLDPCPHTPLAKMAIGGAWCDTRAAFFSLNARNKRVRVFPTRSRARSAWRTCLHRATPEEATRLGAEPRDTNTAGSYPKFLGLLAQKGLAHLADEQLLEPCARVHVATQLSNVKGGASNGAE